MKRIIGVMGPGAKQSTQKDIDLGYEVGKMIAELDAVLLCGGMFGVMESSAKGAQKNNGLTMAIGPTLSKSEINQYIDIPVVTGMHGGRNFINVISSDSLVFISVHSPGTLSELAFAIQMDKPIYILNYSENLKTYLSEFSESINFVNSIGELKALLKIVV